MNATIYRDMGKFRSPHERETRAEQPAAGRRGGRLGNPVPRPSEPSHQWLVDLGALARCRAIFAGHAPVVALHAVELRPSQQSLMHIPPAYDLFCRTHFAAVRRVHPELAWEDACPAYAIALSAHAALCVALDEAFEKKLELDWDRVRGQSGLSWTQARPLIADGCSALDRLDPLGMRR